MSIGSTFPRQLTERASLLGVTLVAAPPELVREFRTQGYGAVLRRPTVHTHLYWRGDLTAGQRAHHVTFLLDLLEQQPKTRELLQDPDNVIPSAITPKAATSSRQDWPATVGESTAGVSCGLPRYGVWPLHRGAASFSASTATPRSRL
jgi:hypothetical protein